MDKLIRWHSWDNEHILEDINIDVSTFNNTESISYLVNRMLPGKDFQMFVQDRVWSVFLHRKGRFYSGGDYSCNWENNKPCYYFLSLLGKLNNSVVLESARYVLHNGQY